MSLGLNAIACDSLLHVQWLKCIDEHRKLGEFNWIKLIELIHFNTLLDVTTKFVMDLRYLGRISFVLHFCVRFGFILGIWVKLLWGIFLLFMRM